MQLLANHRNDAHPQQNNTATATAPVASKPASVPRPTFGVDQTTERWEYFKTRWSNYKTATGLAGAAITSQLLETCDEKLRFAMYQSDALINTKTETQILELMKTLSVKQENVMVSRMKLHGLHQDAGESVRNFVARIKGQAELCRFEITCTAAQCTQRVRYTDEIVRDNVIRNLYDQDIQREILGHENQNMTLEQIITLIETKETGKRAQANLLGQNAASLSTYRKDRRQEQRQPRIAPPKQNASVKCEYCGEPGHGRNNGPGRLTIQHRSENCPSYSTTCNNCHRKGHYTNLCRQAAKSTPKKLSTSANAVQQDMRDHEEEAGAAESFSSAFAEMCASSDVVAEPSASAPTLPTPDTECAAGLNTLTNKNATISIDAQQHDRLKGWINKPPSTHPTVTLQARVEPADYEHFGYKFSSPPRSCSVQTVTDTGCQSPICGLQLVFALGYTEADLIPTKMMMKAIDQKTICIKGAIILRLSGRDRSGHLHETVQVCYVSDKIKQLYLSEQGCKQLGIIPETFPSIGAALPSPNHAAATKEETPEKSTTETCPCIPRSPVPPMPKEVPFPPTEANRLKIENWIKDYYRSSVFNNCQHQPIPMMSGPPVSIHLDPEAKLPAHHKPIPVPLHHQDEVYEGLMSDVKKGVIRPVAVGQKSTAISPMLIQTKKNGKPRRVIDYQQLNKFCARETHHTMSPFHQATLIPANMKKTVTDAWNGYHSVALREEDRHLTTFISPWGRFEYCVVPQGLISAGDAYSRRFDEIAGDFPNKTKIIDDTCMWKQTIEEAFFQACEWIDLCGRNGLILNIDKFQFAKDIVEYAGFEISDTSIKPGNDLVRAIRDFPCPENITDVRSFFGLVNQVNYCLSSSEEMQPFRNLLSPSTKFYWDSHLSLCFSKAKEAIIKSIEEGVQIFDKGRKTCLATDWSKQGIGFSLYQKHCDCPSDIPFCCPGGWKITFAANRFTHDAEKRYAPIEGEALAVAYALNKARHFVLGCEDLIVATDHKPLLKILDDRHLHNIKNPRLFNLKEKTLPFRFKIVHIPGKKNLTADVVSRYPSGNPNQHFSFLQDDVYDSDSTDLDSSITGNAISSLAAVTTISTLAAVQAVTWHNVQEETASDPIMTSLSNMILDGFPPQRHDVPEELRNYFRFREDLSIVDGVVMYGDRIVVPPKLRGQILETLHSAHQGTNSMNSRAQSSVFWPGLTSQLQQLRRNCTPCEEIAPSQPNPPPTPIIDPVYPFQQVCSDYFKYSGRNYLVVVDRYSGWPSVYRLTGGSAPLIKKLREIFVTFGIPEELASDGGPEFSSSDTVTFLKDWGVKWRLSSVAYPHSNCRAELGVKTVKRMIMNNTNSVGEIDIPKFQRAMFCNTEIPPRPSTKGHLLKSYLVGRLGTLFQLS